MVASQKRQVSGLISSASTMVPSGRRAEFQLEVDEADVEAQPDIGVQDVVHLEGIFRDGVDLLLGGQAQGQRVVMVDEGVVPARRFCS